MIEHVKTGLVEHVALLFGPPFGDVHREGAVWVVTGDPDPYRNGILEAVVDPRDPARAVAPLLDPFRTRRQPMMWWFFTGPEGIDRRIHEALRDAGLFLESDRPAMTLPLESFEAAEPENEGLVVERVRNESDFRAWLEVVGDAFRTADRGTSISTLSFMRWGFGDEAPFHHYLARDRGVPVGAATLTYVGDIVSLGNISTRRAMQKRGIAFATVGHALADARARGIEIASLSADPAGTRLYTKLGFETIGRHLTYVWKP